MGREASYQAIPEDFELLQLARKNIEIAVYISSFSFYATRTHPLPSFAGEKANFIYSEIKALVVANPGLIDRYFYAGARKFDAIHYLLSPLRRENRDWYDDTSLIYSAIYGVERLHPKVMIGFVPAKKVAEIATYLDSVTEEKLHEHYYPKKMRVYKFLPDNPNQFEVIWEEFEGMRQVYRAAADHDEAMITKIE